MVVLVVVGDELAVFEVAEVVKVPVVVVICSRFVLYSTIVEKNYNFASEDERKKK